MTDFQQVHQRRPWIFRELDVKTYVVKTGGPGDSSLDLLGVLAKEGRAWQMAEVGKPSPSAEGADSGQTRKSRRELEALVESQKQQLSNYETRLRDVVRAYKGVVSSYSLHVRTFLNLKGPYVWG